MFTARVSAGHRLHPAETNSPSILDTHETIPQFPEIGRHVALTPLSLLQSLTTAIITPFHTLSLVPMMIRSLSALIATVSVVGCTVTPASVRVASPVPVVVVDPSPVVVVPAGGGHCPPGQAKKGRC